MKRCSLCKIEKERTEFKPRKGVKDGLMYNCKICYGAIHLKSRIKHKEKIKQRSKDHRLKNREKLLIQSNAYRKANKDAILEQQRLRLLDPIYKERKRIQSKQSRERNADRVAYRENMRRSSKLNAIPNWLTKEHKKQIRWFYKERLRLQRLDGIKRQVDHIVPLRGKTVCGLHVPWNLQILTADENRRKSNKLIIEK